MTLPINDLKRHNAPLDTELRAAIGRVRQLRQSGWATQKYECREAGGRNSRLDEIQAAVLRVKPPHRDAWNPRRRAIVSRYREGLKDTAQKESTT